MEALGGGLALRGDCHNLRGEKEWEYRQISKSCMKSDSLLVNKEAFTIKNPLARYLTKIESGGEECGF